MRVQDLPTTARVIQFGAMLLLFASPGCMGPEAGKVRLVPRSSSKEAGLYKVTALIENNSEEDIELEKFTVEMTTFDREGKVLAKGYPFSFEGRVGPYATTRLPLNRPDRDGRVERSSLSLKDSRGRVISRAEVLPEKPEN